MDPGWCHSYRPEELWVSHSPSSSHPPLLESDYPITLFYFILLPPNLSPPLPLIRSHIHPSAHPPPTYLPVSPHCAPAGSSVRCYVSPACRVRSQQPPGDGGGRACDDEDDVGQVDERRRDPRSGSLHPGGARRVTLAWCHLFFQRMNENPKFRALYQKKKTYILVYCFFRIFFFSSLLLKLPPQARGFFSASVSFAV